MKFRRKPVEVTAHYSERHREWDWPEEVGEGFAHEINFEEEYEPIDAEAREAWREVYGEEYDRTGD